MTLVMSSTFLFARPKVPSYAKRSVSENLYRVVQDQGLSTHPSLGELSRALVLAVAEQFDDAALVGSEARDFLDHVADEGGALAEVTFHARHARGWLARRDFLYRE